MGLSSGTKLGPYEIVAPLGAGGMGEVYRARDAALGRDVAVKVLPSAFSEDIDRLRRFQQEAQAAAALNHPNILAIYHVGQENGTPYIVSELLEGESLRQRLRLGPLPVRKAIDYALQVARGLGAAHDKGIVHRDLKPDNIFLTRDGRVKILDFGLAKLTRPEQVSSSSDSPTLTRYSEPGVVLGTVGYMSPEQVRGQTAGPAADLFSFGTILYEMLVGKPAFCGNTAADIMSAILKEDPPELAEVNRQIPPALERIVRHCLEKNPEERFQSARDVAFDLEAVSGLSSSSGLAPVKAGRRIHRAAYGVVIGVILLTVGILAGFVFSKHLWTEVGLQFQALTFRHGMISSARFAPDGHTVVYSAAWEGKPTELFTMRPEFPESHRLELGKAHVLAISRLGEMAILLEHRFMAHRQVLGTLALVPFTGGSPREILDDVTEADWSPDGQKLTVARSIAGRYQIEFPIGKVLYETSGWVSDIRLSPRGDMVAFVEHPIFPDDRGSVAIVTATGEKRTISPEFDSVEGIVWSHTGQEIWFGGARVRAVSLSGKLRTILDIGGDITIHDMTSDGKVLLTEDDRRVGIVAAMPPIRTERDLSLFDFGLVSDISNDGSLLLFSEEGGGGGPGYSVYVRRGDGSEPVRLGPGASFALSPDGKLALAIVYSSPDQLWILPIGPGSPRLLPNFGIQHYYTAGWLPDEKRVLFAGEERGHRPRCYMQDIEGGKARPVTPEGTEERVVFGMPISPDGKYLVAVDPDERSWIYPLDGGNPRPLNGVYPGEVPFKWTADGRSVYLFQFRSGEPASRIYRLSLNGRKELFKELRPLDPTGLISYVTAAVTPDGRFYAYSYYKWLSSLYAVDGLK